MRASVHLVDGGVGATFKAARRRPTPAETPGLVGAYTMVAAPLSEKVLAPPQLGRFGLVAFWEDDAAIDRFEADHPLAASLADGWSARLDPRRAIPVAGGQFPGIPDDIPGAEAADHDGPAVVLTIGRLRKRRIVDFLRASAKAEAQIAAAPGLLWATGLADPLRGVVSTLSLWETAAAPHAYAGKDEGHLAARRGEAQQSFHHVGSFVRFVPYAVRGTLPDRRNPLSKSVTAQLAGGSTKTASQP